MTDWAAIWDHLSHAASTVTVERVADGHVFEWHGDSPFLLVSTDMHAQWASWALSGALPWPMIYMARDPARDMCLWRRCDL